MPTPTIRQRMKLRILLNAVHFSRNFDVDEEAYLENILTKMAIMGRLYGSCESFLHAFSWNQTPQGVGFWDRVHVLTEDYFYPVKKPGMSSDVQKEDLDPII